jgi:hypothetical protein
MDKTLRDIGPYTAGTWRCSAMGNGAFSVSTQTFGYAPLAKVKGDKRSTLKQAEANARLISAAPDLLAALYAMMEQCYDPDYENDSIIQAFDLARDAIAKAEGFK